MSPAQLLTALRGLVQAVDRGDRKLEDLPHMFGMLVRRYECTTEGEFLKQIRGFGESGEAAEGSAGVLPEDRVKEPAAPAPHLGTP